ncbi:sigma-70 family RNA polymerase sigma factor [Phragmitibacter flavus]|uniref:Sigma-70 family RNA polymerase sigma factor n=1 Tax=Phragmitibacter flavus TaxID=2576071 RepID=A0A5R8K8X2_9BACT|nr:sigma-70 family RNA polymerase sigma factor [Phragmitibacter flavus]TLD68395.1 sigma-70 family RNA polymerase sigma factor [Phragmitibacter flavus]
MLVETRVTLLHRIADPADQRAWEEFVCLYAPLIFAFASRRGLQHADASDITQEVLSAVTKAIQGFEYDRTKGTFRSWLYTIVRRKMAGYFDRHAKTSRNNVDSGQELLEQQCAVAEDEAHWDLEFRRHIFQQATERARGEFSEKVWQVFVLTALEGRPVNEVGEQLQMRPGAVYVARHRVIRRLHDIVSSLTEEPAAFTT